MDSSFYLQLLKQEARDCKQGQRCFNEDERGERPPYTPCPLYKNWLTTRSIPVYNKAVVNKTECTIQGSFDHQSPIVLCPAIGYRLSHLKKRRNSLTY